jgi:hypothetical protein
MSTLLDSYATSNYSASSTAAATESRAQSFKTPAGTAYNLTSCKFYVYTDAGNVTTRAKLFAHTGTYGASDGVPTGSALATSSDVVVNEGSSTLITYTFSPYALSADTAYCIVLEAEGGADNNFKFGYDGTTPTHGGTYASNALGSWSGSTARDLIFEVYGDTSTTTVTVGSAIDTDIAVQVPTIASQVKLTVGNVANVTVSTPNPSVGIGAGIVVGSAINVVVNAPNPSLKANVNLSVGNVANVTVDTPVPSFTCSISLTVNNTANAVSYTHLTLPTN